MRYILIFLGVIAITGQIFAQNINLDKIEQSKLAYIHQEYIDNIHQSENLIKELMKENNIPGLSITVATVDEILWAQGFGYADLENNVPVKINSKFRIGSLSKTLTALAIGKLIENNQLSLSDRVQKYVSYFPEKKYPIKIEALVSHTSGIRNYNYKNREYLSDKNYKTVEESINIFKDDSLLFQPGSQYSYSTYNYTLLSAVIEGATNTNFVSFMGDSVFIPLDLRNTVPDYNYDLIENRVSFYDEDNGKIVNGYYVNNSNKWAGGGYLSTSYDLALMAQNLLNNQFLSESTKQLLWTPATLNNGDKTNYGIGWRIDTDAKGRRYAHHGGSSIGGRSFLLVYPNEGLAIAVTSNLSTNFDQTFVSKIAELFIE
ncbi:MAG: serine hydrolase domain-containing protein [Gracilimonas sp.]